MAQEAPPLPDRWILLGSGDVFDQLDLIHLAAEVRRRIDLDRRAQLDQRLIELARVRVERA
ncbi:MAG TPA: hypothetical protein EYP98_15220 [Planctomycetes bacterium]|nr:hypothetical protein [Planctomycetota bacterium]